MTDIIEGTVEIDLSEICCIIIHELYDLAPAEGIEAEQYMEGLANSNDPVNREVAMRVFRASKRIVAQMQAVLQTAYDLDDLGVRS